MKNLLPILFFFFFVNFSFSQKKANFQTIYLTGGSILKGEVLNGDADSKILEILLKNGIKMTVPKETVVKTKTEKRVFNLTRSSVPIQNKGLYLLPQVYLLSAKRAKSWEEDSNNIRHATGMTFTAGYQFFQHLAVGGGVGLNLYENILMPAFLDIRGNLTKTNPTIFYSINAGYSFRAWEWIENPENDFNHKGGYFYYPSIGLKFNSRNNINFQFDIGYNIQQQEREWTNPWDTFPVIDKIVYRSLAIRAGVSF